MAWQYFDGNPLNGGEDMWEAKISILNECLALRPITASTWLYIAPVVSFAGRPMRVLAHQAPRAITTLRDRPSAVSHYTRPRIVCMTARFDVTPKITEENRIVRTGKYEAVVTNNIDKNCAQGILLLKQSRGPLATAELYLFSSPLRNSPFSDIC